ncbi:F-box/kelch-repeat protein At3g06240-like [Papaver somniferum]|uniref:F-box/kelch-repeat protein At3g06240-like n=1 Tax=Papaver somniferum TaxID=3469 RepID=UPI000E70534C|nr:F-box/kelch-repeat protein At3g06240-like [Papaver somniferum]
MAEQETLPTDSLENIFSRLSTGVLFTFKKTRPGSTRDHVTKIYYGDPQHEGKIKKYYSENTLTSVVPTVAILEPNGMVGSCNGLVCYKAVDPIYSKDGLAFKCNNPITGETAYIPGLENRGRSLLPPVGGFGYVGSTNEYKVIRISFKYWGPYFQVYTLGSHLGWRDKGLIVPPDRTFEADESGVFFNGALHWINVKGFKYKQMILAFGLADE